MTTSALPPSHVLTSPVAGTVLHLPDLALVGTDTQVPLVGGGSARHVNLDYAASTPPLVAVRDAVERLLPWYSSVHRGAGYKSQVSTHAYEWARGEVAAFVNARTDDTVVFTRNTTDAMNLLAWSLPADAHVITFGAEHHANLLPWRRLSVEHLATPSDPAVLAQVLEEALRRAPSRPVLVSVTAASNVTGELWPVATLADVAHRHGARIAVDAAQLAPHGPVDVTAWDLDFVALSGHKLYAPYGAGALIGRSDWLGAGDPFLAGGGAVDFVTMDEVAWAGLPERQEAGSPNVVGAFALGVACQVLREYGMERVAAEERALEAHLDDGLAEVPGLRCLRLWNSGHPRIGVASFDLPGWHHSMVAAYLSAEHGIAVRDGCFCAHPMMLQLLDVSHDDAAAIHSDIQNGSKASVPGAVRISTGLATTAADLDAVIDALMKLVSRGPAWSYRFNDALGEYTPDPDDRGDALRGVLQRNIARA